MSGLPPGIRSKTAIGTAQEREQPITYPLTPPWAVRRIVIVAMAFLVATAHLVSDARHSSTLAQPVDAARVRDGYGCEDGVGSSYLIEELRSALDNDTMSAFTARREACGPDGILSFTLGAMCAPAQPATDMRYVEIFCSISVWNPSDDILLVTNEQFTLASNTERYLVTTGLLERVVPEDTLEKGRRAYPHDSVFGVIGFRIPAAKEGDDYVLIWRVPNPETSPVSTWKRLQIILEDRGAVFENRLDSTQTGDGVGSVTLSGGSDKVSDPVALPPGIYRVSAKYRGNGNFAVWVRMADGDSDLLFNEIDTYSGEATFQIDSSTTVLFEVTGIGSWEIVVSPAFR